MDELRKMAKGALPPAGLECDAAATVRSHWSRALMKLSWRNLQQQGFKGPGFRGECSLRLAEGEVRARRPGIRWLPAAGGERRKVLW